MNAKPGEPPPSEGGRSKRNRQAQSVELTELLTPEGGPWRPFSDKGVLVKPRKTPRDAKAIFEACEERLIKQLKAVCLWPEKERNQGWRVGDYSFYVMEYSPTADTNLYVQFWSEPDEDGAIFEVSSGAWNPPTDEFVNEERQELLRDHGFEIGGNAGNFRKIVSVESSRDLRAVAREAIAILTKVLGYDGTHELRYDLHLHSRTVVQHVLHDVTPGTFVKMMHEWGFKAELMREEGLGDNRTPAVDSRIDERPFRIVFGDETEKGSNEYRALHLGAVRRRGSENALPLVNRLNYDLLGLKICVDEDGDFVLQYQIFLYGGVTAEHLRSEFALWRGMLREADRHL